MLFWRTKKKNYRSFTKTKKKEEVDRVEKESSIPSSECAAYPCNVTWWEKPPKRSIFFKWELYLHNLYFKQLLSWNWTSTDHKAWSVYCKCRISQRWTCASEAVPLFNKLKRNIERCIKEKIHTYEVLAVVSTFGHLSDPFSSPQELILVIINFFSFFLFFCEVLH